MRKFLLCNVLGLLLASGATAQILTDFRVHDRRWPRPHPPRLSPIIIDLHAVDVKIKDGIARTSVKQTFRNPNGLILEGTFMFPLPDRAAISQFSMMMGGKMIQGEVLERDKAASIYQGIVARQKDPALLEYVGRRLFKARVFPIPAQGTAQIELTYEEALTRDGSTLEYRYPFRTAPGTNQPVGQASVRVVVESEVPVLTVYSPSHEVDVVKKGDHQATVSFESKQDPGDRDFVVACGLSSKGSVGASLFTHVEKDDGGAFLLLLAPSESSTTRELVAKDVIFVVDTSGSMAGENMVQTQKALDFCVKALNPQDRFNLIPFATEPNALFDGLMPADSTHKGKALEFVAGLKARGGTNIRDALVQALSMSKDQERPLMVIFMTDGLPTIGVTDTKAILDDVKKTNAALTRLFVFGVGTNLQVDLLDLLAEQNHGARDYVTGKENIELKISSFYEKVASPVLSDVRVKVDGVTVRDMYPRSLPDLFRGSQLLITGRYQGSGNATIRLEGKLNGKQVEHVFEREFKNDGDRTAFVPRLWAVRKVGFLMDQIRLNGQNSELKDEVVRLGKTYGIVTPYTSYLVIEDAQADSGRRAPGRGGEFGDSRTRAPSGGGGSYRGAPGTSTVPGTPPPGAPQGKNGWFAESRAKSEQEKSVDRLLLKLGTTSGSEATGDKPNKDQGLLGERSDEKRPEEAKKEPAAEDAKGINGKALKERAEAARHLEMRYYADAITLSTQIRRLRDARGEGESHGLLVRRVANRTFYLRHNIFVESSILDLDAKAIESRLVRLEAFSPDYFELAKNRKDLAPIMALGEDVLFVDGARILQIFPAGAQKKPEPEVKEPGK